MTQLSMTYDKGIALATQEKTIKAAAKLNLAWSWDDLLLDYNATKLAELTAGELGHYEWLDDDLHPLWDYVVDVIDAAWEDEE